MARPAAAGDTRLRVSEIYRSIQGESTWAGWPCVFVRTAGCDLRCRYCDELVSLDASGGVLYPLDEVLERVQALGVRLVELTGGEPLLQRATPEFVRRLVDTGYEVLVETGGHHDISILDPRAHAIVDVKTPGSGMAERADLANLGRLRAGDEVKLVLCDRADYEWARTLIREHRLEELTVVNLSPVHPGLDARELAAWILEDGLRVRLNLQLHKFVWGTEAKSV